MKVLKFLVIALLFYSCSSEVPNSDEYSLSGFNIVQWVKIGSEYDKYNHIATANTPEELIAIVDDTSIYYDLTTRIIYHGAIFWEKTDNGTENTIAKLKCIRKSDAKKIIDGLKRLEKINCN